MRSSEALRTACLAAALCCGSLTLAQADDIRTERVHFAAGTTGTTIESSNTGYEIVDYKLGAQAGQRMVVTMTTGMDFVTGSRLRFRVA